MPRHPNILRDSPRKTLRRSLEHATSALPFPRSMLLYQGAVMARDIVQIRIDHIGVDDRGYGHSEGYQVSVEGVVVNDIVDVELEHKSPHKRLAWGRVRRVETRGPDFVRPTCHHASPIRGN